jgi:hypothetical protein
MTSRCRCRLLECWRQLLGGLRLALPDSASEAVCCLQSPQRVGGLLRASIVDPTDLSVDQLRISKGHSHIEVHRLPGPEVDGELIQPGDEGRLLALDGGRDPKRHRLRACGTFIGQHQVALPNPRLGMPSVTRACWRASTSSPRRSSSIAVSLPCSLFCLQAMKPETIRASAENAEGEGREEVAGVLRLHGADRTQPMICQARTHVTLPVLPVRARERTP